MAYFVNFLSQFIAGIDDPYDGTHPNLSKLLYSTERDEELTKFKKVDYLASMHFTLQYKCMMYDGDDKVINEIQSNFLSFLATIMHKLEPGKDHYSPFLKFGDDECVCNKDDMKYYLNLAKTGNF